MPVLPVPIFVALLLFYLAAKAHYTKSSSGLFVGLIVACGMQSLIMSLGLHYGFSALRWLQPISASLIPPLAYLAFVTASLRRLELNKDIWHIIAPVLSLLSRLFAPEALDFVIPGIFTLYGLALLFTLAGGRDSLVRARLESGNVPLYIWRVIALSLLVSAVSDGLILLDQLFNQGRWSLSIIGLVSSFILLAIGLLSLSRDLQQDLAGSSEPPASSPSRTHQQDITDNEILAEEERELVRKLDALLQEEALYLNADLTLAQLARRLRVPAKALSRTINKYEGQNVSRYINGYRIRHACKELRAGQSITQTLYNSGFNTKSNFNREFLRIMKTSPSEWLARSVSESTI